MSSLAYGALTGQRQETAPVNRKQSSLGAVKGYVDALAALIPAEVLAFHALALQFTTETVESEGGSVESDAAAPTSPGDGSTPLTADETVSTESGDAVTIVTDPVALRVVFVVLVLAAPLLYLFAHRRAHGSDWHPFDWLRMLIPSVAFVLWTMLQKSTAFDAVAPGFAETPRFLIAAGVAVALGLIAQELAYEADGDHS